MQRLSAQTKGMLSIIASAFCFALMALCVRLSGDIPSMQKAFFRNVVAAFVSFAVLKKNRVSLHPPKNADWIPLLGRAAFGTLGVVCNFYAVDHLNLSDAAMLNKMSPFFSVLFSAWILSEKITAFEGLSVVIAFLGSLLIIKPNPANLALIPSLVGLLGGMGAGIAYTLVRLMKERGVNGSLIIFVFSAFSCLFCLPFAIIQGTAMTAGQVLLLVLAGVFGCGGQYGITAAYGYAPAREVSVYDYSQIIFSALLGWAFFGQVPDHLSFLGYAVILAAAVAMFLYHRRKVK